MGSKPPYLSKRHLCLALVAPILLSAGPVYDVGTRDDIRCVISLDVWAVIAYDKDDKDTARAAITTKHYYLGRVDRAAPNLNLDQSVRVEYESMLEEIYDAKADGMSESEAMPKFEASLLNRAGACHQNFAKRGQIWLDTMDTLLRDPPG